MSRIQDRPGVSYALKHDDAAVLKEAATHLRSFMAGIPGLYEISDSLALGKRHYRIHLTPAGEAAELTPATVGRQLRANFGGAQVQRIQRGRDEIKVMVRYPSERRRSLGELANERIPVSRRRAAEVVPITPKFRCPRWPDSPRIASWRP